MRYTELMTLLSIFKVTVHMNQNSLEKCEMLVVLFNFLREIRVEYANSF